MLRNGDLITIDAKTRSIEVELSAAELKRRTRKWQPKRPYTIRGVLSKYARSVSSASRGAVTEYMPRVWMVVRFTRQDVEFARRRIA